MIQHYILQTIKHVFWLGRPRPRNTLPNLNHGQRSPDLSLGVRFWRTWGSETRLGRGAESEWAHRESWAIASASSRSISPSSSLTPSAISTWSRPSRGTPRCLQIDEWGAAGLEAERISPWSGMRTETPLFFWRIFRVTRWRLLCHEVAGFVLVLLLCAKDWDLWWWEYELRSGDACVWIELVCGLSPFMLG